MADANTTPTYGLFWSMAGTDTWTCVGLYYRREEAEEPFDSWESVHAGRLVLVDLLERQVRDVDSFVGASSRKESPGG